MNQVTDAQYEELSINTVQGLRLFLENAQNQYRSGLKLFDPTDLERSEQLDQNFAEVRQVAKRLIGILSEGDTVDYADAAELQQKYDRLISFLQQNVSAKPAIQEVTKIEVIEQRKSEKEIINQKYDPQKNKSDQRQEILKEDQRSNPKSGRQLSKEKTSKKRRESEPHPKKDLENTLQKLTDRTERVRINKKTPTSKDATKKETTKKRTSRTRSSGVAKPLKPKTGRLEVAAEETEVQDIKSRLEVVPTQKQKSDSGDKSSKKTTSHIEVSDSTVEKKPEASVDLRSKIRKTELLSSQRLHQLQGEYPEPNTVQQLLFDEVVEGIEYLSGASKEESISPESEQTIVQVVAHIRHALQSIPEVATFEVSELPDEVDRVPVVTEQAQESVEPNSNNASPVSFVPTSVTTKKPSVAKRSIPKPLQTLPKPSGVHEAESLTELYLHAPAHKSFIETHYSSTKEFERILDATVTEIEAATLDSIEMWLGDLPSSAFSFVKDSYVSDVISFARRSYDEVAADLEAENIKYETFAEWRDLIDEMIERIPEGREMKYGQLYARWMLSLAMEESNE